MSLADCIIAGLIGAGITLAVIVIVAIITVLATGTFGTGGAFAAAVVALLASWWVPIAISMVSAFALAFTLCVGGEVEAAPVDDGATIGVGVGASISAAIVAGEFKIRKARRAVGR
jgi:hypothetical protein